MGSVSNSEESIALAQVVRYALQKVERCLIHGNIGIAKNKLSEIKIALDRLELNYTDVANTIDDIKRLVVL